MTHTIQKETLPSLQLIAFAMAGFLAIVTETIPAGLLPQISQGLHISEAQTGQMISIFAFGAVISAIPLITWTRNLNRRPVFICGIAGLLVFNLCTAWSTDYHWILLFRLLAGVSTALLWGLFAGYARRLVPTHLQGRALAIACVGQPLALSLGIPLGNWLGQIFAWQDIFLILAGFALLLICWIRLFVPDFKGQVAEQQKSLFEVLTLPGLAGILATLFLWIIAHNIVYTYLAPILVTANLTTWTGTAFMVFGLASIVGIWITGVLTDRWLRQLTLFSLLFFAVAMLILLLCLQTPTLIFVSLAIWGVTFGGAPTLLQTALADAAGQDADVAQSILVTVFNFAIACGGFTGGLILNIFGASLLSFSTLPFVIMALGLVWFSRAGFKAGPRSV